MLTVIYKVALIDNQKVRSTVIQLMAVPVGIALDHRIGDLEISFTTNTVLLLISTLPSIKRNLSW